MPFCGSAGGQPLGLLPGITTSPGAAAMTLFPGPDSLRAGVELFQRRWPEVVSTSREAPVLLLASGFRSGSTLLQRMLSSECLVWGEPYEEGGLFDSMPDLFRRLHAFWPEEPSFFSGQDTDFRTRAFIANLYPPPRALLGSYVQFFENLFARPAREAGIARWGIKSVRLSADHACFLRWLFPRAKIVFLVRSPYDAFRSYATIRRQRRVVWYNRWPDRPLDAREFGRHWRELAASFLAHRHALEARLVFYEEIADGRVPWAELEAHLGVRIDCTALNFNPGGWPLPEEAMDQADREALREEVEPLAAELGYSWTHRGRATYPGVGNGGLKSGDAAERAAADGGARLDAVFRQAMASQQAGDRAAAEQRCQEVLGEDANHAGAWHLLGLIRLTALDYGGARDCIGRAVSLCQTNAVYQNNLGVALQELGEYAPAEAAFRRAVELHRGYADAWSNLGRVQHLLRSARKDAERSLRNALALRPDHPRALMHLADVYRDLGRLDDAARLCERFVAAHGQQAEAYLKLGESLAPQGRDGDAQSAFERAVALAPADPRAHLSLGVFHAGRERIEEARAAFCAAARLRPDRTLWRWKHLAICPTVFPDVEPIDRYWDWLHEELGKALAEPLDIDWRSLPEDGFTPSFNLPHHGRCCREIKEQFTRLFGRAFPSRAPPAARGAARRRARIGFLVTAGHEPGFLRGTAGIIERLDPARFEAVVFCSQRSAPFIRRNVRRPNLVVVPFPARFDQAVEAVREAACDVLYYWKVGADTWNYFLPMARLAPVQCTSWGTHGTSGVQAVDYYLSSPWMETGAEGVDVAADYTEHLLMLPTFPTWQQRQPVPPPASRADFGLPGQGAIYFCPHRLPKYHPAFDSYLRDVLERDPAGHLVLLSGQQAGAQAVLSRRLERRLGPSLWRRVVVFPALNVVQYYRLLSLATVVLDSIVYAGGITAYDAFSFGIPVVTQPGRLAVQNYTAGLYRRMALGEVVAGSHEEYVDLAVRLGTDGDFRGDVSRRLLERCEVIFEDQATVAAHEGFFLSTLTAVDDGAVSRAEGEIVSVGVECTFLDVSPLCGLSNTALTPVPSPPRVQKGVCDDRRT